MLLVKLAFVSLSTICTNDFCHCITSQGFSKLGMIVKLLQNILLTIVNNIRIIIQRQRGHIYVPDLIYSIP